MGQTLSEPITAKESASMQNDKVKVGSSSMQGWRISMEDAHTHILELKEDPDSMFFAVYDGHGGGKIAAYVSKHLHKHILKQAEYKDGNIEAAFKKGFLEIDDVMRTEESLKDEMSGATAITALVRGNTLYAGNVGDSRAIASIGGQAKALSVDHKPSDEKERARIEKAGGFVEFNRVNGNLALSRALGDFGFKTKDDFPAEEQIVCCDPDVVVEEIDENWEWVLLACDGIWDVLSNQEVANFVNRRVGEGKEPEIICEELMTHCLATDCTMGGLGCDNMTVVLVCLLQGKPYEKLSERCAEVVKKQVPSPDEGIADSSDDDGEDENAAASKSNGEHADGNAEEPDAQTVGVNGHTAEEAEAAKKSKLEAAATAAET